MGSVESIHRRKKFACYEKESHRVVQGVYNFAPKFPKFNDNQLGVHLAFKHRLCMNKIFLITSNDS